MIETPGNKKMGLVAAIQRGTPDDVRRALARLRQGDVLDLSGRELTELPDELAELTDLRELRLTSNRFERLPPQVLALAKLEILDLSSLPMPELPVGLFELRRLRWLDLSYCELPNKIPEALGRLLALRRLDLERSSWDLPAVLKRVQLLLPRCEIVLG